MITVIFYGLAFFLLVLSYIKDRDKTFEALKKAWKSFENIMPQFLGVIFIVGVLLTLLKPEMISDMIGKDSGITGVLISAAAGSITTMPTFVAFQTAEAMLKSGAGYAQVGALVSTLTLVGVVTFPLESKYIGKKGALYRNAAAFAFSLIIAFIMGRVMGRT